MGHLIAICSFGADLCFQVYFFVHFVCFWLWRETRVAVELRSPPPSSLFTFFLFLLFKEHESRECCPKIVVGFPSRVTLRGQSSGHLYVYRFETLAVFMCRGHIFTSLTLFFPSRQQKLVGGMGAMPQVASRTVAQLVGCRGTIFSFFDVARRRRTRHGTPVGSWSNIFAPSSK